MTFGVFMHKDGSIYDDMPEVHYQFKEYHLPRAEPLVGGWVVYLEPAKERNSKGYFAVARVGEIIPDPEISGRYRALIEKGSYLPFSPTVPRFVDGQPVEGDCYNSQWSIRPLSNSDFARIISLGLPDDSTLPRVGGPAPLIGSATSILLMRLSDHWCSPSSTVRSVTVPFDMRCCTLMTVVAQSRGGS